MSKTYTPGYWTVQYESLSSAEKTAVAKEVDESFRKQTGVARTLNPTTDRELMRTWLRIRDDVMARRRARAGLKVSKVPGPHSSSTSLITGSVGDGGFNYEKDIALVKLLLNQVEDAVLYNLQEMLDEQPDGTVALRVVTLVADGNLGPETMDRIRRFQRRVVGMSDPDGLIEPNGKTIQELMRHFLRSGSVFRLKDFEGRLHPHSIYTIHGGSMMLAGLVFRRGQIVNGLDGKRLILSVTAYETIFMLLDRSGPGAGMHDLAPWRGVIGSIYAQSTDSFVNEYETYFWRDLSRRLAPIQTMIEVEVNLLMAIGTTMTGTAIFYAGFTVSDFIARNHRKFKHWLAIFEAILEARDDLQRLAPTLYDKLFDALFMFYLRSLKPGNVAKVVGSIIGKGGEYLLHGKLNVLLTGVTLALGTVVALLQNLADSVTRAEALFNRGIRTLAAELRAQGVTITPQEQLAIFNELRANPGEIKRVLTRLNDKVSEHMRLAQ